MDSWEKWGLCKIASRTWGERRRGKTRREEKVQQNTTGKPSLETFSTEGPSTEGLTFVRALKDVEIALKTSSSFGPRWITTNSTRPSPTEIRNGSKRCEVSETFSIRANRFVCDQVSLLCEQILLEIWSQVNESGHHSVVDAGGVAFDEHQNHGRRSLVRLEAVFGVAR